MFSKIDISDKQDFEFKFNAELSMIYKEDDDTYYVMSPSVCATIKDISEVVKVNDVYNIVNEHNEIIMLTIDEYDMMYNAMLICKKV